MTGSTSAVAPPARLTLPPPASVQARRQVLRALNERTSGLTVLLVTVDVVVVTAMSILVLTLPIWWALAVVAFTIACRTSARVYRRRLRLSYFDDVPRSLSAALAAFGAVIGTVMLLGDNPNTSPSLLWALLGFLVISELLRSLVFALARFSRRRFGRGERTLVVGSGPMAVDLMRTMLEHTEFGLRPVGFLDPAPQDQPDTLPAPMLGSDLQQAIVTHRIGIVVLADVAAGEHRTIEETILSQQLGCTTLIVPRMPELYRDGADVERLRSYPLVRLVTDPTSRPTWVAKRVLDVVCGVVFALLLTPVLALTAVAVLVESGRPVLFAQERVGRDGHGFRIFKFRSMRPVGDRESQTTWTIAGDPRIGPVGRLIRRTSLDELPQLFNIIRGDMSLIGPRPERPGFVQRFSLDHEWYWARHRVPPGLTGLAQVNGLRGDTSIADRARYDNYYIANWSLWLDLKIVLLTTRELLRRGDH